MAEMASFQVQGVLSLLYGYAFSPLYLTCVGYLGNNLGVVQYVAPVQDGC